MKLHFKHLFAVSLLLTGCISGWANEGPSRVEVRQKQDGAWELLVDGQPFHVKGIGCNQAVGEKGEDYIQMAKEMGANALRTWGDTTPDYLDRAHKAGLMVNVGIWINPVREGSSESFQDEGYQAGLKNQILSTVREFKDHPAVLAWNIGNEVFAYTVKEEQKVALGKFLNEVIQEVHKEDPNHPVVYAAASTRDLPEVKKYLKDLDIVGVNIYGSVSPVLGWVKREGLNKPLLVTEYGPLGSWDQSKDPNDLPFDPMDQLKASNYESLWRQIAAEKNRVLGGFAFVLGEPRNQDSVTWYNINYGTDRRASYWMLHTLYTQQQAPNRPPKISSFKVDSVTGLGPGQTFNVSTVAADPEGDDLTYSYFVAGIASDPLIVDPVTMQEVEVKEKEPGTAEIKAPDEAGNYRVYVTVRDGNQNIAIANRTIQVFPSARAEQRPQE